MSNAVRFEFDQLFLELSKEGKLVEPFGKKIDKNLYEMRVSLEGQWRGLYAYTLGDKIIILSFFGKKTQKLPAKEKQKALRRLKEY